MTGIMSGAVWIESYCRRSTGIRFTPERAWRDSRSLAFLVFSLAAMTEIFRSFRKGGRSMSASAAAPALAKEARHTVAMRLADPAIMLANVSLIFGVLLIVFPSSFPHLITKELAKCPSYTDSDFVDCGAEPGALPACRPSPRR